MSDFFVTFS